MGTKQKTFIALLAVAAVVLGIYIAFRHDKEPIYKGKRLSAWLAVYARVHGTLSEATPESEEALIAVSTIGTNALPFLLEWIRYEIPQWKEDVAKRLPRRLLLARPVRSLLVNDSFEKAVNATWGFEILGTNAASAIPELDAILRDNQRRTSRHHAMASLASIGSAAIPALTNALADTNQFRRDRILLCFRDAAAPSNTNLLLLVVSNCLNDPDLRVRSVATNLLKGCSAQASTNAALH